MDRKIYSLQACACTFYPGNFTGWGSEGVNIWQLVAFASKGIAQLVERPTKKPGAILTRVRIPGEVRKLFSQSQLPVQTQSTGLRHPSFSHCRI